MRDNIHPKVLTGAKLKRIDKHGDFVFSTDDGWFSIPTYMLIGITDRDVHATGKLVRVTKNGKDRYQWVEDVEEQPATQIPVKKDGLTRGLNVGKTLVGRLLR
jgi:tRNA U38,U39,U40 pseudouridine synthase TruA